jgi:hypothetical protein
MKFPKSQKIEPYNDPSRQTRPSSNTKGAVIYDTFYLILMINNEHEEKASLNPETKQGSIIPIVAVVLLTIMVHCNSHSR